MNESNSMTSDAAEEVVRISAVDLFCGVGGLTRGLSDAGVNVAAGIDLDPACSYPYRTNNHAKYVQGDIESIDGTQLAKLFRPGALRLLAGCAPCQPFSTYSQGRDLSNDRRWNLLQHFSRLVKQTVPDFVTMENVPRLERQDVFAEFVRELREEGYHVSHGVVDCSDYGVPQSRRRLVLLASRHGEVALIPPTVSRESRQTVRDAIGGLPAISAGQVDRDDPLHQASGLAAINLKRIRASKPGGSWRDWPAELVASCHRRTSGRQYDSVYGRMGWDEQSPTMTTQFFGFGNGRFGHPEQDRGLSLREGAILQSFPRDYRFVRSRRAVNFKVLGRLIGNAVPVKLGEAIGRTFVQHAMVHCRGG